MRIVVAGGTGQIGGILVRWLRHRGHQVQVIGRGVPEPELRWDGRTLGPWAAVIDGADAVINLAGRSVNCRYHWANLNEMMQSRVDSARVIGQAIARADKPPAVWLQASTASIYADTRGTAHDEHTGELGGREPGVPAYWAYSVAIARAWELALEAADTPHTRKVALRTGFTMSPDREGIFDVLVWLAQRGLGGPFCGGDQYVSWMYDEDLARAVELILHDARIEGPVNLTAPEPLPNRAFMAQLCADLQTPVALPITGWMAEIGAAWLKTDTELMRKSRRVVPTVLLDAGFEFVAPTWADASPRLVERWQRGELLAA